jgi:4-amino-4-deoxy-L-arabinose transferase-like glycosyltransferase
VEWALVGAITLGAAVLRLAHIGQVPPDPFYDAAVRSMGISWHNFFFGAFEPGGSVSIDKPPVDLWLQVISVKLLGFSSTTLKLPEAFAGIASVPLLYIVVRRMWSAAAGVAAAAAMAVLPIAVITARSDTMDAVMMFVIVLALLAFVRAVETGRRAWLLAGAAALGVAFDVKLLESLVALPGLALFAYLGLPGSRVRRLLSLSLAAVVYVAVALAWLTATLLFPAHERPYAIGSTNGSAWNAAFVFNGTDRLGGKTQELGTVEFEANHRYPVATQEQRDHIPIGPPSPTRLLATVGPLSGERLGLEIVAALLLGIPALLWGLRGEGSAPPGAGRDESERREGVHDKSVHSEGEHHDSEREQLGLRRRMRRASAGGLSLWMLVGIALFSHQVRLHPRYVEGFTPAVAAMLGIGLAWAASPGATRAWTAVRAVVLAVAMAVIVFYGQRLLYGYPSEWWTTLAAALGAVALSLLARRSWLPARTRALLAPAGVIALALVAVLVIPLRADSTAITDRISDAGLVGQLPGAQQHPLSAYLRAHQDGAYYEVAAESATAVGSLIVQDGRPVLVLTTYDARVFTSVPKLQRLIAAGKVRYAFLNTFCAGKAQAVNPACSAPARWVRAHGTDVSLKAGLSQGGLLYLLPGAKP